MEGRGFRDLKSAFDEKNAVILGVSFDSVEENARFAKKYDFDFPLLCDTDRSVGLAYGATTKGETGGAARIGVLVGPDGKVKDYRAKVSAKDYPAQVLELI